MLPPVLIASLAASLALAERSFVLDAPAEVVATVSAACHGCDWGRRGHEAAALELRVDGRYSQHLLLTRGEGPAAYRVALGRLTAGPHRLQAVHDLRRSARHARDAEIRELAVVAFDPTTREGRELAHAPVLEARPNSVAKFTDVPLAMWVETESLGTGATRLRYSVVFSNEDGGTPPDRLMATWGRLTDIEYVYGVEVDGSGRIVSAEYQGPEHRLLPFSGRREAGHPVLHVKTDNNMVSDRGKTTLRLAPAAMPFDLTGTSREAVMDALPWTYAVSAREARREGRIDARARPGSKKVPDPRRFATVEACAATRDATIAFSVAVRDANGTTVWFDSDGGRPAFRIGRRATEFPNGCFRGAVALPAGTRCDQLAALRFRAFTRIAGKHEPRLPPGSGRARLRAVNAVFLLGVNDEPGPSQFSWRGDLELPMEGPPVELRIHSGAGVGPSLSHTPPGAAAPSRAPIDSIVTAR